ncbi:hypothetical protein [Kineosporia babensis]|uniref:Uncharacterized protein n=1 Tax=Kineosporia babensis TaxID=499548 RepID=A0A9X1SSH0_9ACTN|nr:hypothetical protein [Kineosporia babensis]MCD5310271.1 hypothetical protein [Kineosporia babensis]
MIVWVLVGFALGFAALKAIRTLQAHRERLTAARQENQGSVTSGPAGPSRTSASL